jgi:lactate permease
LNWIAAGGTLLIAGLITIPLLSLARAARAYVTTLKQLRCAILTVVTVLALGCVIVYRQSTDVGGWRVV